MDIKVTSERAIELLEKAIKNQYRDSYGRNKLVKKLEQVKACAPCDVTFTEGHFDPCSEIKLFAFKPNLGLDGADINFENRTQYLVRVAENEFDVWQFEDNTKIRVASGLKREDFTWNENGYWDF